MDSYYLTKVYHIEFCSLPENTSDQFLLMFLRANHFDVPATVNMIKNFRWMFQTYPQYFQNAFDPEKAGRVKEIFERHIQVVPSLRDSKGRRLMIYQVPEILGILRELMWFLEPTIKWIPPHEKL